MIKRQYQQELDRLLLQLAAEQKRPRLLLHGCCAPCSSYVLEYLASHFEITLFYYNPNIFPQPEYQRRTDEVRRLLRELPQAEKVSFLEGAYEPERFFQLAKGHEQEPEGGERCLACYGLRLRETARAAKENRFEFFTTTLSISPYKNAEKLNQLGAALAEEFGVSYLFSDFKKKNGYKRSIELSKQYGLYRQDYCGCVYSAAAREQEREEEAVLLSP